MKSADSQITEVAGYRLITLLGSGGMGDVYKGYNSTLNRDAAIKILHMEEAAERFKNEAYIQSSVNHPNIARLYDYVLTFSRPCIVMEYVEGETLDVLLKRKGRLPNAEVENIVKQIAGALAYLHKRQIIHRDIKPSNFKLQPDGTVKMLDFGIAKNKYSPKLTQVGFVVGTVEYISPEQFQQRPEVKSDVWALAVMTYEMVTGYLPFEANNPVTLRSEIMKASFTDPKLLVPAISVPLETFIEKGLRSKAAERISAADTERLFEKRKRKDGAIHQLRFPKIKKQVFVPGISLLVIVILFFLFRSPGVPVPVPPEPAPAKTDLKSIMINVSGVLNAEIILDNNSHQPLPFPVKGKEGEKVNFTLHAEGFRDKPVELEITSRRSSYEFTLEKINR